MIVLAAIGLAGASTVEADPFQQRVNATAAVQAAFLKRVDEYMQLHQKLEATLPKLPDEATPQQIDQNQRAMGELVAKARANAKPGDLFTPDMQNVIRRLFADVFKGKAGQDAKKYIHDEPHPVTPEINKRYPDTVPLATMPLRVLAELPKLPEELEYASLKFAVLGDFGDGSQRELETAARFVAAHDAFPFEFVALTGDNLYGSERPQDFAKKFEQPFKPLLDAGVKF
jgi:hypothetical protein